MSRRDQDYNRRNQSYLTEPYYEHYYSDLDINDHHQSSSNRPMPPSPRHQTINNERYGEFNPARPYTNKKSIGDIWKKLTSKANKTFQKTFKRDSSKLNVMGRESLASLPELSVNQSYNPGHRRIVSVRPLPSPPQFNTNPRPSNHQRRPTGPRELPATLQNVVDQKARFNKVTEYESILHRDFEGLVSLLKLYHNCEDARIEKAIRAKWTDVKVSMHEVDDLIQSMLTKPEEPKEYYPTNFNDDDALTAVTTDTRPASRSSSSDSIDYLKKMTQKLASEVGDKKRNRRSIHC